ncbi:Relaxase/Mobilisation nuclease domain-containing protein [Porphyromonadaceae bacterium NLAE-zl-C104]|uniref:relaxase/mobilization nuclease domain-containing protein n=1 Tax=Proteiniphilum saccharofermentans TaxID=1642647 RepID=UPI000897F9AA|nr:relaxase/mobilization nuclease domain-containing protein [Proteiniphilum saccharofermentans]SEA54250.1 Relaxase/Mobilisation nuclease domain-containing protein [Porphyromonadaceae bacterium KH3R12]SFT09822.1 Relaxase/Mobilisation nuclease domain-containing protein [Porphyromonadaceae bacterium NLAE-zl-C104]
MMAKITKGSSFKGVIRYVIDEKKETRILKSDGLRLKNLNTVIDGFVTQAGMIGRVSKPVGHISLDFSAQDKEKLSDKVMVKIAHDYMQRMGITGTQYIIARHFDKDHPHIHLVFNRVDNNGKTISDSNDRYRSEKICKELTHKYGLYYPTGKENVKHLRLKEPDKSRYEIYEALKTSVPRCRNWKELMQELDKAGIKTEFKYKGNTTTVEGVKFRKGEYTFNGSKVDRMFSYSKIEYQLKQNARQSMQQDQAQSISATVHNGTESIVSGLGGLFDIQPRSGQNDDQAYLYRQPKKKKKRRYGRQM